MDIQGRPWIIMSGVSRGIGHELAVQLSASGYRVCALARSQSRKLCDGIAAHVIDWDCALPWTENPSKNLLDFVQGNPVVGFIHAAGVLGPMQRCPPAAQQQDWQVWWDGYKCAMRVNHLSAAEILHALKPHLRACERQGQPDRPPFVLHLSSGAAVKPYAGWDAYCSSKAALLMEFKCLAAACTAQQLLVLSVAPGTVMTDMMRQVLNSEPEDFPSLAKFRSLESSGGLVPPEQAAGRIAAWLTQSSVAELNKWHGELYDVRSSS